MENRFRQKKVLVTGGAGAIGSRLAKRLVDYGAEVFILDDMSSGRRENIPEGSSFYKVDITTQQAFNFRQEVDYIFHCAGFFANQKSILYPKRDLEVNGIGTLQVLEWAKNQKRLSGMVYLSSSCVYGPQPGMLSEERLSGKFDTPYAMSKYIGEGYCKFFFKYYGLPVAIVRLFNIYGPGEYPGEFRNVIPNFIDTSMKGKPLIITGTGNETRDFTFVENIVDGILLAVQPDFMGEVFNLGTGKETTILYLAELINKITGNPAGLEFIPKRRWDNIPKRSASINKAKSMLGFNPDVSIEEGLDRTYRWFKTWWKGNG